MVPMRDPDAARLYDLAADPLEANDVASDRPEQAGPLREAATSYMRDAETPWGVEAEEVELDAMRLDQLRALGYVIEP